MAQETFLNAHEVMARYRISRNTLYSGPLRALAIRVAGGKGLRWPLSALRRFEHSRRVDSTQIK